VGWHHSGAKGYFEKRMRRTSMSDSPYLRMLKNKIVPLDPYYLHELEILRAMVRKEDRSWSDSSWGGELTKERYRQVREKYPEACKALESELWAEKGRDQRKIRTRRNLVPSPYIERNRRELSDSEEKELRSFKNAMIHMKLGYGSQPMAYILTIWKDRYPEAYEAFQEELG
jgi:hypothetical protein